MEKSLRGSVDDTNVLKSRKCVWCRTEPLGKRGWIRNGKGNIFRAAEKSREPFLMGVSGEENHQVLEKT